MSIYIWMLSILLSNAKDDLGRINRNGPYTPFALWNICNKAEQEGLYSKEEIIDAAKQLHYEYLADAGIPAVLSKSNPGFIRVTTDGAAYYISKTRKIT